MRQTVARRRRIDDDGFSLVEVLVALGVAAIVLLGLLSSAVFAARSTVDARRNQQAADYVNSAIEAARSIDYASVSMLTTDLSPDANITTVGAFKMYDPGTGLEKVDATTNGTITPHLSTVTTSNGSYTTKRYVTIPSSATFNAQGLPSVRRVTVEVSFTSKARSFTRKFSTILTLTRRGLPLPYFTWKYDGPATLVGTTPTWTKNPGNVVDYGFFLNNLGARDGWTISASTTGWSFYLDTNHNGLWDGVSTEPPLTLNDTGLIEPGSSPFYLVASRTIGAGESGTSSTVFTATSDASTTVNKTVQTTLILQTGAVVTPTATPTPTVSPTAAPSPTPTTPCNAGTNKGAVSTNTIPAATTQNAYTLTTLNLYNSTVDGDSSTLTTANMSTATTELDPQLCNWSTDLQTAQAGRFLANSTGSATAVAKTLDFRFQPPSAAQDEFRGTPVLTFYAQCTATGTPTVTVNLKKLAAGTLGSSLENGTVSLASCSTTTFTRYSVSLSGATDTLASLSDQIVVQVQSSADVRIGYGSTTHPATFVIGLK